MIICCGEALIDMIPEPASSGATGYVPYSGGSVFNTAIAIGRLGGEAGFISGLSTDFFGDQLRGDLRDSGVDASFAVISGRPTTLAFVKFTDGHASYAFFDENTAGRMLNADDFGAVPDNVQAMFFGGISLVAEPCGSAYAALAAREAERRTIMLDPNIREAFITDEAAYRERLQGLFRIADIVKVSDHDLGWIFPSTPTLQEKARMLLDTGPAVVILTQGEKGATAYMRDVDPVTIAGRRVEVADTVGAGDTFNAGFLTWAGRQEYLAKARIPGIPADVLARALEYGVAAASICVSRHGANPPWAHELAEIGL
jgi:fructokinase